MLTFYLRDSRPATWARWSASPGEIQDLLVAEGHDRVGPHCALEREPRRQQRHPDHDEHHGGPHQRAGGRQAVEPTPEHGLDRVSAGGAEDRSCPEEHAELQSNQSHDVSSPGAERDPNAELGRSLADKVGRDSEKTDSREQKGQRAETAEELSYESVYIQGLGDPLLGRHHGLEHLVAVDLSQSPA